MTTMNIRLRKESKASNAMDSEEISSMTTSVDETIDRALRAPYRHELIQNADGSWHASICRATWMP